MTTGATGGKTTKRKTDGEEARGGERDARPGSMSTATFPARASLSPPLASSLSVFRLVVFSPGAPVVTRRPPELTGGRVTKYEVDQKEIAYLD